MNKRTLRETLGWGFSLWLIGYVLGILLFAFVPTALIGWIIMPVGVFITLWILFRKVANNLLSYYVLLGIVWTVIAIVLDYVFIIKAFKPADGYYKLDVYLYYAATFILPLIVGLKRSRQITAE